MNFIAVNAFCASKLKAKFGSLIATLVVSGVYVGLPFVYYLVRVRNSCVGVWDAGFKGSQMIQDENYCYIDVPDYCWYDILDGVQDISGWMGDTC